MNQLLDHYQLFLLRSKRDPEAFGRIYDKYAACIYRFVYLKLPSKEIAQDVTSEAFLRLWQYVLDGSEIRNIRALLYRIARNLVADHYRKAEPQLPLSESVTFESDSASYIDTGVLSDHGRQRSNIEAKADLALILERISRLKEDYRDVLILRLIDGLGFADIAAVLEKTPGHVRVIYHRALKALETLEHPPISTLSI